MSHVLTIVRSGSAPADADDFEPAAASASPTVKTDKWDGEDEDDDVKDAWDADSDKEDGEEDPDAPKAVQRKKKKKLADIIAEKEAAKAAQDAARREEAKQRMAAMTPEAKLAEKLRLQKIEESANLQLAKDMIGRIINRMRLFSTFRALLVVQG